jgi:hypothetical protein
VICLLANGWFLPSSTRDVFIDKNVLIIKKVYEEVEVMYIMYRAFTVSDNLCGKFEGRPRSRVGA